MSTRLKCWWLFVVVFVAFFNIPKLSFAQVTLGTVDSGPFTPGSTLAVPFKLATDCLAQDNRFELYLSDENGSFATETLIGTYTGFYSTYVNGILPANAKPGLGYKIRVKTTSPATVSGVSGTFEIKAGAPVEAKITSTLLDSKNSETFGNCTTRDNNQFFLTNESTPNSNVSMVITNEVSQNTSATINYAGDKIKDFTASLAHYTILTKAVMPNGTVGTKAYLLINNQTITAFGTQGNNLVCLPLGLLTFNVDILSAAGIQNNFPGNLYTVTWGDGSTSVYSLCDIKNLGGRIQHAYKESSCGQISRSGASTIYNAFDVTIKLSNAFCNQLGTPISSWAKVVIKPVNSFTAPKVACLNSLVTVANSSVLGQDPNTNTPECANNTVTFNWFVDGKVVEAGKPYNFNLQTSFLTKGEHTIRLESNSSGACNADPFEMKICIQDPSKPAFSLAQTKVCVGAQVKTTDLSVVDNTCTNDANYYWSVTPAVTYANGTSASSKNPEFVFSVPGVYTITLGVATASCGLVVTPPQVVVVNETPKAILSPDAVLCNLSTYDFNNTTLGPTKTLISGTSKDEADTYLWTVTAAGSGTYSFAAGSNANSKYPSIKFDSYDTYTISLTQTNNCGSTTAKQKLTFTPAPVVNAGIDQQICFTDKSFALSGLVTGTVLSQTWVGGSGTFTPSRNALNAVYTPTDAERASGSVTLQLKVTTPLGLPCNEINDDIILKIKENLAITSPSTLTVCTGNTLNYQPISAAANVTYTWVATGSINALGFSLSGSGNINEVLTNQDATQDATVTYIITPQKDGCIGLPFTLVVTVKPKPSVTALPNKTTICSKSVSAINLTPTINGTTFKYSSTVSGNISGNTQLPTAGNISAINDVLINTGNTPETVTYTIIPVSAGACDGQPVTVTLTVLPAATMANAGGNQTICSGSSITLNGNNPAPTTGKWTLTSGQSGVNFTDATLYNTEVTGLVAGQTYTFKWSILALGDCEPSTSETTVTYFLPLTNHLNDVSQPICSGEVITLQGDIPTGGNGSFSYQWQSSTDGNTWINITSGLNKDLEITALAANYYRRLVNSGNCASASNVITLQVLPGLNNNTITGTQQICLGTTPAGLVGANPVGGNGNFVYQWQQSTDGINFTNINGANAINFNPSAINSTTYYRRLVSSGTCGNNQSNTVKVTVNFPAKAEIIFVKENGCAPFKLAADNISASLYPDRNASYTWFADGVQIGTGATFPGYTIQKENQTVKIKLMVTSSLGCATDELSHDFTTQPGITAAFTSSITSGCGPLTVNFTNTSTSLTAANFTWDFGNGTISNLSQPNAITFQPDPAGKDKTYTVTLSATTPCGVTQQTETILVKANPISVFSPDKTAGCSPFTVTFSNTSPGNDGSYTFDFGDGTTQTVTDKSSVTHTYTTLSVKDFVVKMTATNACGTNESQYTINVAPNNIIPELVVNSNQLRGCAPFKVDFYNNTKGANRFTYNFGDGNSSFSTTAPEVISHTFNRPGKYTVTLNASNDCSTASTTEVIEVLEQPQVSFTADKTAGCDGMIVRFKNTSKNAAGYIWDFGDGTTSTEFEPEHTYSGLGKSYNVTLTAINDLQCNNSLTLSNFINVVAPPTASFVIKEGNTIAMPNYDFNFVDLSTNAASWEWDFGDGAVSSLQNPKHTYGKFGSYTVTLKVYNKEGCTANTFQSVRIVNNPGFLNLPNAFMPASATNDIKTFKAKGKGIKEFRMTVFNKWGQMIWETTKLDDGAPAEGWDGTFNGQEQPQGIYFWKVDVKFSNGSEWKGMSYNNSPAKKTGEIYLIR